MQLEEMNDISGQIIRVTDWVYMCNKNETSTIFVFAFLRFFFSLISFLCGLFGAYCFGFCTWFDIYLMKWRAKFLRVLKKERNQHSCSRWRKCFLIILSKGSPFYQNRKAQWWAEVILLFQSKRMNIVQLHS